jgi:hypothetical protein
MLAMRSKGYPRSYLAAIATATILSCAPASAQVRTEPGDDARPDNVQVSIDEVVVAELRQIALLRERPLQRLLCPCIYAGSIAPFDRAVLVRAIPPVHFAH